MTRHGTRYGYRSGCTCSACVDWNRTYRARQARERALGRGHYAPAAPVRAHVRTLTTAGLGLPQIAKCSGVHASSISFLLYGKPSKNLAPPRQIVRSNATAILGVTDTELAAGARVAAVGAQRRAQALVAVGWSLSELARETGIAPSGLRRVVYEGVVWKATADKITAAYERLWDRAPAQDTPRRRAAVTQARRLAERKGWFPPLAWDDDQIDDPTAVPDRGLVTGRSDRRVEPDEVEWLRSFGTSDELIARQLRVSPHSIYTAMRRHEEAA